MGAIVLLQRPFCKPGKTMKYCTLVSTLMARLPRIYISFQISDLKSISNAIVKIASLSSNKVEWRRRFDPEKFDCPSEDHSIKPINKQLRGKSKNNAGTL